MSQLRSVLLRVERGDKRTLIVLDELKQGEIPASEARDELVGPGMKTERTLCCFLAALKEEGQTGRNFLSATIESLRKNKIGIDEAVRDIIELVIEDCSEGECPHEALVEKAVL
ncbi:MAG: hypothetical protein AAB428_03705 [Patescibacteria group bacterium]